MRIFVYVVLILAQQWWAFMLMIASGDASKSYDNLIQANTPEFIAKTVSKLPYLALNFWVWFIILSLTIAVAFLDWKFPYLFPRKFRRVSNLNDEQKDIVRKLIVTLGQVHQPISSTIGLDAKITKTEEMQDKILQMRNSVMEVADTRLASLVLKYCHFAEKVWQPQKYLLTDYNKMTSLRDKIIKRARWSLI